MSFVSFTVTPVNATAYSPTFVPLPLALTSANVSPATLLVYPLIVCSDPLYSFVPLVAVKVTLAGVIVKVPGKYVTV